MTKTEQCRAKAKRGQCGSRIIYWLPCYPTSFMVEHLGAIKERGDGRWDWWRWKSKFHTLWMTDQGVALSQGAAELRVLEGWATYDELNHIKEFMEERELTPGQAASIREMTEEERISYGYVHVSHASRDLFRNDV